MISLLKTTLRGYPLLKNFLKSPIRWFKCAFLTIRYVDEWRTFPAFQINGKVSFNLTKGKGSKLVINKQLVLEQWMKGNESISLELGNSSTCIFDNQFTIGNGVRLYVADQATLLIKGVNTETGSGITANSIVMVKKYLELGYDSIVAWDTFLTDCDWHGIYGKEAVLDTIVGDHVWIGVGCKVLKGANIGANSIVTSLSVVLAGEYPKQSLLTGAPARISKTDIPMWSREMPS